MNKRISILILSAILVASCERQSTGSQENISKVTTDTVMIDSGSEIVMAASNMFLSGFSQDNSKLYHYINTSSELEVIDLNGLKLEKKLKVEKEGPDGVGMVNWFNFWNDSIFVFYNFNRIELLTTQLTKASSVNLRNSALGKEGLGEGYMFQNTFTLLDRPNQLLSAVTAINSDLLHLAFLDFENEAVDIINNDELLEVNDYSVIFKEGRNTRSIIQPVGMLYWNKLAYIFNQANNKIFSYDPESKQLSSIHVEEGKVKGIKSKTYRLETESWDEFRNQVSVLDEELKFKRLVHDPASNEFYRIAYHKTKPAHEDNPARWDAYLLKYDKNFKLLAEVKILDNTNTAPDFSDYFIKDGKLWLRVNINDELGFVRFHVN